MDKTEKQDLFGQIFMHDELIEDSGELFQATGCTLAVDVGPYQAGKEFDMIEVLPETSELVLYELNSEHDEDDEDSQQFVEVYRTTLKLSVA